MVRTLLRSVFHQGICSSYRKAYWTFLMRLLGRWSFNPPKLSLGFTMLLSGHHFISYTRNVVAQLESELAKPGIDDSAAVVPPFVAALKKDRGVPSETAGR
jgi:hypothetical protein